MYVYMNITILSEIMHIS